MYNQTVASFIKLLIKSAIKSAIKSTYILENSLVRHVHIYDGILNDVNISATKTFRTFRQLTFFSFFPGKYAFRPHYFIMYPKAILPQGPVPRKMVKFNPGLSEILPTVFSLRECNSSLQNTVELLL